MSSVELKRKLIMIDELQKEINAYRPLSRYALKELKEYYRISLAYSSNALEGNSLTESETKVVIEEGITIGGKPLKDHYEAVGHSEAFDLLYKLSKNPTMTERDILALHRLFYFRVDPKNAGKYRTQNVIITGTDYTPPGPDQIGPLMKEFTEQLPGLKQKLHPVEYAAFIHLELVTIHPFVDGNGRAGRLLMNLALLQAGYTITIIPPIMRSSYLKAIRKTQGKSAHTAAFTLFIAEMICEGQKDFKRLLKALNS